MKLNLGSLFLVSGCAAFTLFSLQPAQAQPGRGYVKADLGGNWTHDADLKEFFGEPIAPGAKVKFDPGIRFGFGAGYFLTEWLAGEVESGVMANYIDTISGASHVDATFSNIPLLFNLRLQCPRCDPITPYIGGGAGASFPIIDADHINIGATSMHGSEADAVFAYQGFAGLRYRLNSQMGLSLEYHYFHADGADWKAEFTSGTATDHMRFGGTDTHAVSVAFDFHF